MVDSDEFTIVEVEDDAATAATLLRNIVAAKPGICGQNLRLCHNNVVMWNFWTIQ